MRLPVDGLDWVFMTEFMPTSKNVGGNYSAHRKNFNIPNTDDKSEKQIREQMSGPDISSYEKSIMGCGLGWTVK